MPNKALEVIKEMIAAKEARLVVLREELDRLDSQGGWGYRRVSEEISDLVAQLQSLYHLQVLLGKV